MRDYNKIDTQRLQKAIISVRLRLYGIDSYDYCEKYSAHWKLTEDEEEALGLSCPVMLQEEPVDLWYKLQYSIR